MSIQATVAAADSTRFEVVISAWEARMSLWVETPSIVERASGQTLLSFEDGNWSLNSAHWIDDHRVELRLRKYPGAHHPSELRVSLDCIARTATLDGRTLGFDGLERALEAALSWPAAVRAPVSSGWIERIRRLFAGR
jgi:hypothetical protein